MDLEIASAPDPDPLILNWIDLDWNDLAWTRNGQGMNQEWTWTGSGSELKLDNKQSNKRL